MVRKNVRRKKLNVISAEDKIKIRKNKSMRRTQEINKMPKQELLTKHLKLKRQDLSSMFNHQKNS